MDKRNTKYKELTQEIIEFHYCQDFLFSNRWYALLCHCYMIRHA